MMNVVIFGAGEVGQYSAKVLGNQPESADITIVDQNPRKLRQIEESFDVGLLQGNATHASAQREAGVRGADLALAVTNSDEANLICGILSKKIGAKKVIVRVSHSAFLDRQHFQYDEQLGIDHLVCPDQSTGTAIAETLRTSGALAIERFARGKVELRQISVSPDAYAVGKPLMALPLSQSVRLATIQRKQTGFMPDAQTVIKPGDVITLIGQKDAFEKARKLFRSKGPAVRSVVVMGGSPVAVWLCRALRSRHFAIRLYTTDRARAEDMADKLPWVNVSTSDLTDPDAFEQERISQAEAFVAVTPKDEENIVIAARAKSGGVNRAIALLQRGTYLHLLKDVGIDQAFSPRVSAVNEIVELLDRGPLRHLASLAVGVADIYELTVPSDAAAVVGKPLKQMQLPNRSLVAAIQRGDRVHVPGANDTLQPGDSVVIIGRSDIAPELRKMFQLKPPR